MFGVNPVTTVLFVGGNSPISTIPVPVTTDLSIGNPPLPSVIVHDKVTSVDDNPLDNRLSTASGVLVEVVVPLGTSNNITEFC